MYARVIKKKKIYVNNGRAEEGLEEGKIDKANDATNEETVVDERAEEVDTI